MASWGPKYLACHCLQTPIEDARIYQHKDLDRDPNPNGDNRTMLANRRKLLQNLGAVAAASAFGIDAAFAQSGTTVRLVVGFPPGGPSDTVARMLADRMRVKLNRPVVVDNKPGAASRLARAEVKRAVPDGNTLIFSPVGATTVLPHLFSAKNLGYTPEEFSPVARVAGYEYVLTAGPGVTVSNLAELKAWLIKNPSHATLAHPGTGTIPNLLGLVLAKSMGVPITQVAYKGTTPALQDLMGGHVSLCIETPFEVQEFHRSGKLKVLASISETRSPLLPDVPTLIEQGLQLSADSFHGVWAPAGTPADVIRTLNAAIVSVLAEPAVKDQLLKLGLHPTPSTPAELTVAEKADSKRWADFIKETGVAVTD